MQKTIGRRSKGKAKGHGQQLGGQLGAQLAAVGDRPAARRSEYYRGRPAARSEKLVSAYCPPGRAGGRPVTSRWYRKNFFIFCQKAKNPLRFGHLGHFGYLFQVAPT